MPTIVFIIVYVIIAACQLMSYRKKRDCTHTMNRLIAFYFMWLVSFPAFVGFICHAFFPAWTAAYIGWPESPFQTEIALANLGVSVVAFISFFKSGCFRWAAFIPYFIFYVGAGINHIVKVVQTDNMSPGNGGIVLYTDLIIPTVLLIMMLIARKCKKCCSR